MSRRIGVCSWSLRPESAADLIGKLQAVGLDCCQLHLDPLRLGVWKAEHAILELFDAGIEVRSGMMGMKGEDYSTLETIARTGGVRPDHHWKENLLAVKGNAKVAQAIGVDLVTFHAGFLPSDQGAERTKLVNRLREIADVFGHEGVRVGLETGQESAVTLLGVLAEVDRANMGVNFDPANMLLYGMGEPVAALRSLASRVFQVHVKDALPAQTAGAWGTEVPVGSGAVDWKRFFDVLREKKNACDLMIEREAGDERVKDVRTAHARIQQELADAPGAAR
ncbi:MAG: TIM barrel protein [Planctomycetes bacterium]|nr:TIM barrel protein [Planctomycetota bacterium]